jgi:pantothenate synthetase
MNPSDEYQQDCERLVASVAIRAADGLGLSSRAMIYRGIISLLPENTEERAEAEKASKALEAADQSQLRLFSLLPTPPTQTPHP